MNAPVPVPHFRDAAEACARECQGRAPVQVWGMRGMVSSMHPTASQVGADILRSGGNAMDAAVAVGAAISVLSPDWAGPAGDSAWLVYDRSRNEYSYLDGYATCPASITPERIAERFGLDPETHPRAYQEEPPECRHLGMTTAMVPGTPAAWCDLSGRHGSMPLATLLEPAIALAAGGFPVNNYLSSAIAQNRGKLEPFPASASVWLDAEGAPMSEGRILRQADLADTLRRIAQDGRAGFYTGDTAEAIVRHAAASGGSMQRGDLADYRCAWRDVLKGSYRGRDILVTSPPTAGVHVLQALNILEGFPLESMPFHGAAALHLTIEALKLALSDRRQVGGDPDFLPMDVGRLADKSYAALLRGRIRPDLATARGVEQSTASATTHFVVADGEGNLVSATQTIGSRFGCGETVPGTGLLMNDRTWWMSLAPGPNQISARRRANIGHAATIIAQDGIPIASLGSPGGFGIVQYMVQAIVHMVDYGLDIQRAIEAARFKIESLAGRVGVERRLDPAVRVALASMGHQVFEFPEWSDRVGGIEGVAIDAGSGVMMGGYDPRRNSMAVAV